MNRTLLQVLALVLLVFAAAAAVQAEEPPADSSREKAGDGEARADVSPADALLKKVQKHVNKGHDHLVKGEYEEALFEFDSALQHVPGHTGVWASRGQALFTMGRFQEAEEAFRAGEGDYVHLQNPNALNVVTDGVGHLAASVGEALGPIAFSTLAMSRRLLTEETETAQAFMRAYLAARQWILESDAETIAEALHPLFPETAKMVLAKSVAGYKELGTWLPHPGIARQSYERALDMWLAAGQITRRYPFEEVVTNELIEKTIGMDKT